MKKNGFTLVELLAVVSIISLLLLLVAPKIVNQLNNSKKDINDVTKKIIYNAAEKYIKDNNMNIEYDYCLSVEELQDKEYLSDTITDNKSGLDISKKSVVITPKDNLKYEYELTGECNVIATQEDYRGYYADVDGDGIVDGVIYADLAHASRENAKWGPGYHGAYASYGEYSYTAKTGLKEYTISENKHTGENAKFGEKEIITLKPNSTGNSRFYVMALKDFTTEAYTDPNDSNNNYPVYTTYYWYKNATGKMTTYADDTKPDFGKGYENTGKIIEIWNKNGTGDGSYEGATQDKRDIWKHIQEEYQEGWYIPSRGEWAAFADYFEITSDYDTGSYVANGGNYNSTYGLSNWYWSSSQYDTSIAWLVDFYFGGMYGSNVDYDTYVRLGATF